MSRPAAIALALVALACSNTPERTDAPMQMKPAAPTDFAAGPDIAPAAALLAWLDDDANAPPRRLRLPVVVTVGVLGVESAVVAMAPDATAGALAVKLDDGGLGVGVADTLRSRCKDGKCAVWLEGQWGELVAMPSFDDDDEPPTFAVLRIGEPVAAGDAAKAYAQKQ